MSNSDVSQSWLVGLGLALLFAYSMLRVPWNFLRLGSLGKVLFMGIACSAFVAGLVSLTPSQFDRPTSYASLAGLALLATCAWKMEAALAIPKLIAAKLRGERGDWRDVPVQERDRIVKTYWQVATFLPEVLEDYEERNGALPLC